MELRSMHACIGAQGCVHRGITRGDVMLIRRCHDDNEIRNLWKLGVVEELNPERDGQV